MLDYKVQTHEMLDYYADTDRFGYEDGFSIAAGMVHADYTGVEYL